MKEAYKDIIKKVLYYGGHYSVMSYLQRPPENRLLVLMYHHLIRDGEGSRHWSERFVPTESQFEKALVTLKKQYRVISVEDAVQEIRQTGSLRERSAAITFDDGYFSTYEIAFPLLKKHGLTATIYILTDWLDGRMSPWWIALTGFLDRCVISPAIIAEAEKALRVSLGGDSRQLSDDADSKLFLQEQFFQFLMCLEDTARNRAMSELAVVFSDASYSGTGLEPPMTWAQVSEMAAAGIKFGAHTCSHTNLSHADSEMAEQEIVESKLVLQRRLGAHIFGFAYPYGNDVEGYRWLRPVLEKHDFIYACTAMSGNFGPTADPYLIGRLVLPQSTSTAIIARTLSLEYNATAEK